MSSGGQIPPNTAYDSAFASLGHPRGSSQTAHTRAPVTTGWKQPLLRGLPVTAQQLREDRILEEAAVTAADPQHLCAVFNITPETGLRYTRFFHPDPTDSDDVSGCNMETS